MQRTRAEDEMERVIAPAMAQEKHCPYTTK